MAGSYLSRLLEEAGRDDVVLYDEIKHTGCGQRPCAWGMAPPDEYRRLVGRFLEPDRYVVHRSERVRMDGALLGADILMVDKPRLLRDMTGDVPVHHGRLEPTSYDLVVDATGVERAYLGPVASGDLIAELCQYRVESPRELGTWFQTSRWGYGWCFPLGAGEYHIGYGNLPPHIGEGASTVGSSMEGSRTLCRCKSRIRLSSPHDARPLTRDNIVGVGESIGTVAPLGGDGNLYAMQCAELLMQNLEDLDSYQREVLSTFDWMRGERATLLRLLDHQRPSAQDIRRFLQHARRAGFTMGPLQALKLLGGVGGD